MQPPNILTLPSYNNTTYASHNKIKQIVITYLDDIESAFSSINLMCKKFHPNMFIRPIQCESAISDLEILDNHICGLYRWLEHPNSLPPHLIPLRLDLVFNLRRTSAQISQLKTALADFKYLCYADSNKITKQQRILQQKLELLMQSYEQIRLCVDHLITSIQFKQATY